jgi:hypothetical protein
VDSDWFARLARSIDRAWTRRTIFGLVTGLWLSAFAEADAKKRRKKKRKKKRCRPPFKSFDACEAYEMARCLALDMGQPGWAAFCATIPTNCCYVVPTVGQIFVLGPTCKRWSRYSAQALACINDFYVLG